MRTASAEIGLVENGLLRYGGVSDQDEDNWGAGGLVVDGIGLNRKNASYQKIC